MAASEPTDESREIALSVPTCDESFLIEILAASRRGILEDLANHPRQVRDPDDLRRRAVAFERWLDALEDRAIVPDPYLCEILEEVGAAVDRGNDYERAVREHEAIRSLLRQVREALAREMKGGGA